MREVIIADTSCFIILTNIGEVPLLQACYEQVTTTVDVAKEFGNTLPGWVVIATVIDTEKQRLLELQIDKGESSAIALALETPGSLLILDDFKARKIASFLQLQFTGTVGVIIQAKLSGIIPSVKPLLRKIRSTDFRLSADVEQKALVAAGED